MEEVVYKTSHAINIPGVKDLLSGPADKHAEFSVRY
jgi:hypothetical protein